MSTNNLSFADAAKTGILGGMPKWMRYSLLGLIVIVLIMLAAVFFVKGLSGSEANAAANLTSTRAALADGGVETDINGDSAAICSATDVDYLQAVAPLENRVGQAVSTSFDSVMASEGFRSAAAEDASLGGLGYCLYHMYGNNPSSLEGVQDAQPFVYADVLERYTSGDPDGVFTQELAASLSATIDSSHGSIASYSANTESNYNALVWDEDLGAFNWRCGYHTPEAGLQNVLVMTGFVPEGEDGEVPEILFHLRSRQYIRFGPCPAGGIDAEVDQQPFEVVLNPRAVFEASLGENEEEQELGANIENDQDADADASAAIENDEDANGSANADINNDDDAEAESDANVENDEDADSNANADIQDDDNADSEAPAQQIADDKAESQAPAAPEFDGRDGAPEAPAQPIIEDAAEAQAPVTPIVEPDGIVEAPASNDTDNNGGNAGPGDGTGGGSDGDGDGDGTGGGGDGDDDGNGIETGIGGGGDDGGSSNPAPAPAPVEYVTICDDFDGDGINDDVRPNVQKGFEPAGSQPLPASGACPQPAPAPAPAPQPDPTPPTPTVETCLDGNGAARPKLPTERTDYAGYCKVPGGGSF